MSAIKKATTLSTLALLGLGLGAILKKRKRRHTKLFHHDGRFDAGKLRKRIDDIMKSTRKQLDTLASDAQSRARHASHRIK
jgi:hypothetical protein